MINEVNDVVASLIIIERQTHQCQTAEWQKVALWGTVRYTHLYWKGIENVAESKTKSNFHKIQHLTLTSICFRASVLNFLKKCK